MAGLWPITISLLLVAQMAVAQTRKIKLFDFTSSSCDHNTDPSRLRTRIMKKQLNGNIMTVEIASTGTCCVDFIPRASLKDGVLNLNIMEAGTPCECICCYEFTYVIKGIKDRDVQIRFQNQNIELSPEKFQTYPIRFSIFNGDTINYYDKYGFRQGKFNYRNDSLMERGHIELIDDIVVKLVTYHPDKSVKSIASKEKVKQVIDGTEYDTYPNYNRYIEFFESGNMKRECISTNSQDSFKGGSCKEWNDKGELIYEGVYRN